MVLRIKKISSFILYFIFVFIKSEIKIEDLIFKNEVSIYKNLNEFKYYHIITQSSNLPNYIKLIVKDNYYNKSESNYIDYIISYYQKDKTFKEKNQISYNPFKYFDNITMWLNKEQIKNGFYLSIESSNSTCNYSFEIYPKKEAELNPGEVYSYFVTNENKQMQFSISGKVDSYDRFTLWAQGKKNIITKLDGIVADYTRGNNCNFTSYYIQITNKFSYSFSLEIDANIGDLITVGSLNCDKQNCRLNYFYDGIQYFGFLFKGAGINCLPTKLIKKENFKLIDFDHSYKEVDYAYIQTYHQYEGRSEDLCMEMSSKYDIVFYSFKSYETPLFSTDKNMKLLTQCDNGYFISKNCYIKLKVESNDYQFKKKSDNLNDYKFIKDGENINLILESDYTRKYISIETLSGKIELTSDKNLSGYIQDYSYKNIHIYILDSKLVNNIFYFNIKGIKNSIYTIKIYKADYYIIYNIREWWNFCYFNTGGNYLFNFINNEPNVIENYGDKNIYLKFYPIGCDIDISYIKDYRSLLTKNVTYIPLQMESGFYQEIVNKTNKIYFSDEGIHIKPKNNNDNTCFLYVSDFLIENNETKEYETGIILEENFPQSFLFNKNCSTLKYNYYFIEKDKKINIEFNLLNKGEYKMNLFINDIKSEAIYNIRKNQTIQIEQNLWKNKCDDEKLICKISFNISLEDLDKRNSFLEINIIQNDNDDNINDNNNDNTKTVLIVIFSIIGLVLLIVIIFIIIICKKKKYDSKSQIESILPEKDSQLIN